MVIDGVVDSENYYAGMYSLHLYRVQRKQGTRINFQLYGRTTFWTQTRPLKASSPAVQTQVQKGVNSGPQLPKTSSRTSQRSMTHSVPNLYP